MLVFNTVKFALVALQFVVAISLTIAVLLHAAKGEGLGSIGGTARLFGSQKGLEAGLDKITTGLAIAFLTLSAILGIWLG